jgi:hypothetical protein
MDDTNASTDQLPHKTGRGGRSERPDLPKLAKYLLDVQVSTKVTTKAGLPPRRRRQVGMLQVISYGAGEVVHHCGRVSQQGRLRHYPLQILNVLQVGAGCLAGDALSGGRAGIRQNPAARVSLQRRGLGR